MDTARPPFSNLLLSRFCNKLQPGQKYQPTLKKAQNTHSKLPSSTTIAQTLNPFFAATGKCMTRAIKRTLTEIFSCNDLPFWNQMTYLSHLELCLLVLYCSYVYCRELATTTHPTPPPCELTDVQQINSADTCRSVPSGCEY